MIVPVCVQVFPSDRNGRTSKCVNPKRGTRLKSALHFFSNAKTGRITEFRQQHRKTLDGRLCAAAFLHDDQTYTDCTSATSPDGTSGREWCYVEVQLLGKGSRDWDFCTQAVNYDKVRLQAKKVFEQKSLEADRLRDRLHVLNSRVHGMLQKFDSVCGKKHELISTRIDKINEWLRKSSSSIEKIELNSNELQNTKSIIGKMQGDMQHESIISKEAEENCEESPGYENEPFSDGLKVTYFNNSLFEGPPIESRIEKKEVNFFYNNRGPLENLSPYKYSIRYEGYLLAPHSGTFIFMTETDCSVRLLVSSQSVIENPNGGNGDNSDNGNSDRVKRVTSIPVELVGGEKHRFELEVSHASHLKFAKGESASMKLLWKSGRIGEQVIPSEYFFSEHIIPPTRFSMVDADLFELGLVDVGEDVYRQENTWVIKNIPSKYIGLHFLKTDVSPQFGNFSLSMNTGSNLFIASPIDSIFPLSPFKESLWKIYDTGDILKVENTLTKETKLFKIKFIPLKYRCIINFHVSPNIPFLIFAQQRKILPTVCNGEEEVLSSTQSTVFKECTESSYLSKEFNCLAGLSTFHVDRKYSTWRTSNGSVGEYIHIYFKKPVQVNKFRFKPRDNVLTWPSEISLQFDDSEVVVPVLHTSSMESNTTLLEHPVVTTSVRVEIRDMFTSHDETGGSFEIVGSPCDFNGSSSISGSSRGSHHATIDITDCRLTLKDFPDVMPLLSGDNYLVTCDSGCIENISKGDVYGSETYSIDSNICKAAVHAGICMEKSRQNCQFLVIIRGKNGESYVGSLKNNILSLSKHGDSYNLSFFILPIFTLNINQELYSSTPDSYSIVFKKKDDLHIPNRFIIDSGDVFTNHGNFAYGWNKPITYFTTSTIQKHRSSYSNGIYSGGINFPPASASEHCITDLECQTNFWKFQTHENGTYTIQVLVGNTLSIDSQRAFIEVNGLPLIKNVLLQKGEFFVGVKNVHVTNRTLVFTSTCLGNETDCVRARTTILAIQIVKIQS
ncbi:LCCL domain-containing protein (CCp5) [Plasmodium ovale curtisi]|uniref:LCCL domain-containing protein (CCp5) n=1 Tax=Plasmodium ovale curtisi TaxID=864141 RepID=A0A1A8VHX4_PLAOA|nr:LCCL domain-containing protein (CCp5) [Plasmodium ovale curtisi]